MLAIWKWDIIASPPYWDFAMGLYFEADFLAESHFDYYRLWTQEKRFTEGGPAVYLISVLPTLIALCMVTLQDSVAVLVVGHLSTFFWAAIALVGAIHLMKGRIGLGPSIVTALAIATTPLFSVQVDMLGMDVPALAVSIVAVLLFRHDHLKSAILVALLAFFFKPTAMVTNAAFAAWLSASLVTGQGRLPIATERRRWNALSLAFAVTALEMAIFRSVQQVSKSRSETTAVDPVQGLRLLRQVVDWCPELSGLFLAILLTLLIAIPAMLLRACCRGGFSLRAGADALADIVERERTMVVSMMIVFMTLAAVILVYTIPRYLTLPLPFLFVTAAFLGFSHRFIAKATLAALLGLIVFNVMNQDGRYLPALGPPGSVDLRTGALLERSREYLPDHRSNIEAVKAIAQADLPVIAPAPFGHFLTLPRLGYVHKAMTCYSLNSFLSADARPMARLFTDRPKRTIHVRVHNRFSEIGVCAVPPRARGDRIVYRDELISPLLAYEHEWPARETEAAEQQAYADFFFPEQGLVQRARQLAALGRLEEAHKVLREVLAHKPLDLEARLLQAQLLLQSGKLQEAQREYAELEKYFPDAARVKLGIADLKHRKGDKEGALEAVDDAIALAPQSADAHHDRGYLLAQVGKLSLARESFLAALDRDPDHPRARHGLASVHLALGDRSAAEREWTELARRRPEFADGHQQLSALCLAQGRVSESIAHARRAIAAAPDRADLRNDLAWLLATSADDRWRDGAGALTLAKEACALAQSRQDAGLINYLDTLAVAQAETGAWPEALRTLDDALQRAQTSNDHAALAKLRERRAQFEQKKPVRQAPATSAPAEALSP